jgi:hypothetical protein
MKSNPKTASDFEKFREFVRKVVNVPGAEVKRKIEQERQERAKKKRAKISPASRAANDRD